MTEDSAFVCAEFLVRHFVFEKTAIKWKAVDDSRASWLFGVCDETVCRFVLWERFSPIFWPDSGTRLFSLWHNLHQMCRERTETNGNQQRTSRSRNTRLLQQVNGVSSFFNKSSHCGQSHACWQSINSTKFVRFWIKTKQHTTRDPPKKTLRFPCCLVVSALNSEKKKTDVLAIDEELESPPSLSLTFPVSLFL